MTYSTYNSFLLNIRNVVDVTHVDSFGFRLMFTGNIGRNLQRLRR